MGQQLYGYGPDEHEYSVDVPAINTGDDVKITLYLSAHGGGTVGEEYAANGWDYLVTADGVTVLEGSDIRSAEARAAGHAEMARSLATFLAADGESLSHAYYGTRQGEQYGEAEAEFLAANYERLGCFALGEK